MITGKVRVSAKGWVVIPKAIRDELGIKPGDEVQLMLSEGGKELYARKALSRAELVKSLRGKYKLLPGERPWTESLLDDRRKEVEQEDRKFAEWRAKINKRSSSNSA